MAHASGVKSSIVVSSNVFFAILISAALLRQEKMTARKLVGCIAGFAGVVLINTRGGALDFSMQWNGEGFVLLSALAYACSSVMVKGYARRESPVTLSGYQFVWGGLVLIALGLAGGGSVHPSAPAALLLLGYLGLLSAVAYSLWAVLLQYNPVSRVAIYGFMKPGLRRHPVRPAPGRAGRVRRAGCRGARARVRGASGWSTGKGHPAK